MQRINIEDIIYKLKKLSQWEDYINKLERYVNNFEKKFRQKIKIDIRLLCDKEGVIKVLEDVNFLKGEKIFNFSWNQRKEEFKEFFELEEKFKFLFVSKYKFCPLC